MMFSVSKSMGLACNGLKIRIRYEFYFNKLIIVEQIHKELDHKHNLKNNKEIQPLNKLLN